MASYSFRQLLIAASLSLVFLNVLAAKPGQQQAIASAHPKATQAGMKVLQQGGNAFDAAVTVAAVLAVVEPYGSGIGGGGFWLLHRAADEHQVFIDGRERAPLAAHRDMYLDEDGDVIPKQSIDGAKAAGIPGTVAALVHIQKQYGSLPLKQLLQPAIELAEQGFVVEAKYQRMAKFRQKALMASPAAGKIFLDNGNVPEAGYKIIQRDLANTLARIATQGHQGFYAGEVAERLVKGVQAAGGIWQIKDLAEYKVVEREPIRFNWQGYRVTSAPLPSAGGIGLAQILQQLEHAGWHEIDRDRKKTKRIHVLVEAIRRAYRDRAEYLGDSDFIQVDANQLTSANYTRQLAATIKPDQATPSEQLSEVANKHKSGDNTTHYSVLDKSGNRVSATLSINYPFGSGFMSAGTGVLLNDEMDDFSISPGVPNVYGLVGTEANAIAPGKRMLSSMSPSFIEYDQKLAIIGTPGGSRIITMVLQAMLSLHDGADAEAMVSQPRIHHQYLPDHIQHEPAALTSKQQSALQKLGHTLKPLNRQYGNMQVIIQDKVTQQVTAASDPRGIGQALVK